MQASNKYDDESVRLVCYSPFFFTWPNEKSSVYAKDRQIDTIVADDTGTIKLILCEQLIDSVHTRLSYHFNNLTICIFDDEKFVNSNELTAVEPIVKRSLEAHNK